MIFSMLTGVVVGAVVVVAVPAAFVFVKKQMASAKAKAEELASQVKNKL